MAFPIDRERTISILGYAPARMRRQDELLTLYPGCDSPTKKFILSQAESLALAFDSEGLLELLQQERGADESALRHQAVVSVARFLPLYLRKRYALSEHVRGLWTAYAQPQSAAAVAAPLEPATVRAARAGVYMRATQPLVTEAITRLSALTGDLRTRALLALSAYPTASVAGALAAAADADPTDLPAALARARQSEAAAPATAHAVRAAAGQNPDLLLVLGELAPAAAVPAIRACSSGTNGLGRMNLAQALVHQGRDPRECIGDLVARGEGWVTVYALRALEAWGQPEALTDIMRLHARAPHDFVKAQAVRAASGIGGPDAIAFCLDALKSPVVGIQAQALESLVRLKCPPDTLGAVAAPLLASTSLRARVNALLAVAEPEHEDLHPALTSLLMSNDPIERLEGAYCLGFLQNKRSRRFLESLVRMDPVPLVRVQAVKSLSKYVARDAVDALVPLLASEDRRLAMAAARVLARYEGEDGVTVATALTELLGRPDGLPPYGRAVAYRTLGTVACRAAYDRAVPALLAGLDDRETVVVAGALEGWAVFRHQRPRAVQERLAAVATGGDPRNRTRALLALFVGGDLEVPARAAAALGADGDAAAAVELLLEIGLLRDEAVQEAQFPDLARALGAKPAPAEELIAIPQAEVTPDAATAADDESFSVKRPPLIRKSRPVSVPATDQDAVLRTLEEHLKRPDAAPTGELAMRQSLRMGTYVVADHVDAGLLARLAPYRALIAAAAALVLVVLTVALSAANRTQAPKAGPRHPLAARAVFGDVKVHPPGAALERHVAIPVRARLVTGEASRLELVTGGDDVLQLGSGVELTVQQFHDGGRGLEATVTPGRLWARYGSGAELQLAVGPVRLRTDGAVFDLAKRETGLTLTVVSGRVTVSAPKLGTLEVTGGHRQPLE